SGGNGQGKIEEGARDLARETLPPVASCKLEGDLMTQDELERTLFGQAGIVPSSGFASRVMDAVRREASEPAPIPFPWRRAFPALAAGVLTLAALIVAVFKSSGHPMPAEPAGAGLLTLVASVLNSANMYGLGWVLLAMLVTLGCATLSMRLTT